MPKITFLATYRVLGPRSGNPNKAAEEQKADTVYHKGDTVDLPKESCDRFVRRGIAVEGAKRAAKAD